MKHRIDPKSIANVSYTTLLGYQPHHGPAQRLSWPVVVDLQDIARHHPAASSRMGVGETRYGVHEGTPYALRRVK